MKIQRFELLDQPTYDALNDLTQVSQGSQTRTFRLRFVKRLTSATNPEAATATVDAYDSNGMFWSRRMRAASRRMSLMMN